MPMDENCTGHIPEPHQGEVPATIRSWLFIAKCIRVQVVLWQRDGWNVKFDLRNGLAERAMNKHESGVSVCDDVADLQELEALHLAHVLLFV